MNSDTAGFTALTHRIRRQPPVRAGNTTNMCGNSKIPCGERRVFCFVLFLRGGDGGGSGDLGLK